MDSQINYQDKKTIKQFESWLAAQGLEQLPVTNQYEVFRFNSKKGVLVLYTGKRGYSANGHLLQHAFGHFQRNEQLPWRGKPSKRVNGSKTKRQLLTRDGNACFYCGIEMISGQTPLSMTEEHLLSMLHGGNNRLENKVLAHKRCNERAGHLPIIEKIKLRDRMHKDRALRKKITAELLQEHGVRFFGNEA